MNYYDEIKNRIIDNETYCRVKDYSKERNKVITYFEIGKLLNEAGGKYGDKIIEDYANRLMVEVGKKYNRRTLFRMKQFYNVFSNEKVSTLWTQLIWSHLRLLFNLKTESANYYIQIIIRKHLSVRELELKIKSNEYERLPESIKNKLITKDKIEIKDLVPNPIIIKSNKSYENISEKVLQKLILEDIESNAFCFIGSEYKIKIGNSFNYIDLLLYNYEYNCFIVVELKVTELRKDHIGQIEVYMNYIDQNIKKISQDKTIGIIICRENNEYVIKYCSDNRIISREYEIV